MVELRDEGWGMRAKRGGMREKGLGILVNDKEKWWGMRDKVEGMYDEEWWMCEEKWGVRDKLGEIINEDWRIRGEGWGEVSEELLSEEVWRTYCVQCTMYIAGLIPNMLNIVQHSSVGSVTCII